MSKELNYIVFKYFLREREGNKYFTDTFCKFYLLDSLI